jgi:hypothetical protein
MKVLCLKVLCSKAVGKARDRLDESHLNPRLNARSNTQRQKSPILAARSSGRLCSRHEERLSGEPRFYRQYAGLLPPFEAQVWLRDVALTNLPCSMSSGRPIFQSLSDASQYLSLSSSRILESQPTNDYYDHDLHDSNDNEPEIHSDLVSGSSVASHDQAIALLESPSLPYVRLYASKATVACGTGNY